MRLAIGRRDEVGDRPGDGAGGKVLVSSGRKSNRLDPFEFRKSGDKAAADLQLCILKHRI